MISVVIPTYKRREILRRTLAAFGRQTLAKNKFEVIVVDDGSDDGTEEFMAEFISRTDYNLKYFYLDHGGPERARNYGAEQANGEIILFCGDDTLPDDNLLRVHFDCHEFKHDIAVLGLALWDESAPVTDFMKWLAPAGPQFHYNTIKNKANAGFDHFYTCNISLAKKWLDQEQFDTRLNCVFEDIDLGLRLSRRGLKIIFAPEAKVYHCHFYNEESFGKRMERVGRSAVVLFSKYRNDRKISLVLKIKYAPFYYFPGVKLFNLLSGWLAKRIFLKKINPKFLWFWQICYYYSLGILKQLAKNNDK